LVNAWKHCCRHAELQTLSLLWPMMQLLFVETRERNSLMKLEEILFLFLLCRLGLCFCSWNKKTCALATSSSALHGWIAVDLAAVHSCGRMGTFVRAVSAISTHRHRYTSPVIFPVPQGSSADVSVCRAMSGTGSIGSSKML
jgi:hypothetical protein